MNTGKLKVNLKTFMRSSRNKVKLSPQLQLGVGRGFTKQNYLKYIGFLFLGLSLILTGRTIYLFSTKTAPKPQVLGAEDQPAQPASGFIEYKVKAGDTVFNISQTYGISWTTIATLNGLSSPFTLKPGQTLKIPQQ
jgi:hypothetical protein